MEKSQSMMPNQIAGAAVGAGSSAVAVHATSRRWLSTLGTLAFMKNIEISSPETDRKIARPASIIFMSLIWVFTVLGLAWYLAAKFHHQPAIWNNTDWQRDDYIFVGIFSVVVVFIPVQVIRYFRRKRA